MANTFTNTGTDFIGNLVLDQFVSTLSPLKAFTLSATNQQSFVGNSVKVLSCQTGSAALDYAGSYVMQTTEATGIDVTLNKHKYTTLELKDSEWRDSGVLEVENFARSKGYSLALGVMQDVMTFVSSSFATVKKVIPASTAFSASAVVGLSAYCDTLNWPQFERSMVLSPTQHSYLRQDTALQSAFAFGSPDIIRRAEVPSLDTFSHVYKSSIVPASTVGYLSVPNAVVFASRVVQPQKDHQYTDVKVLTDEDTGLSITQLSWYNCDAGSRRVTWTINYGYALGNSNGCVLLTNS